MRIRIYKFANKCGITQAYRLKIKGFTFPRIINDWYFCDNQTEAIELALIDYNKFQEEQKNKVVCLYCNQIIKEK